MIIIYLVEGIVGFIQESCFIFGFWKGVNGFFLQVVFWGQGIINIWSIISIFFFYGFWGENYIFDIVGSCGYSFKMKIYSLWFLVFV